MSYFNMVCDGCGREVQGYNIVNGMKFCAKCYQEIFGNKNMTENLKNMYEAYLKILNEKDQRIAELEEQLKNAIRFKTPQVERFAVVQYIHWEKKPYKIVNCFDAYKDENMKTRYCFYGVPSTNFKVIQICDTKEEAEAKLQELGEKK